MSDAVHKSSAVSDAAGTAERALLVEPSPCLPPIKDTWRRAGAMGLNRAIANVVVQRLCPQLADKMQWPLQTTAMGRAQLCYIYPTIPPQGHWFTLAKRSCEQIASAAAEQARLPSEQRAEVALLAVWRPQSAGADRRVHVWSIPADIVARMSARLASAVVSNRNVGIDPPVAGRPSVWRKGKDDASPIPLQACYQCWTLSESELAYVQDAERNEIRQTRERMPRAVKREN